MHKEQTFIQTTHEKNPDVGGEMIDSRHPHGFECQLYCFLVVLLWANHLIPLCLSFLTYKIGMEIVTTSEVVVRIK